MSLYVKQRLEDGATVIADDADDSFEVVLGEGQWDDASARIYLMKPDEARAYVRSVAEGNRTPPSTDSGVSGNPTPQGEGKVEPS